MSDKTDLILVEGEELFALHHRAGQVADWERGDSATVKDAFRHYRGVLDQTRRRALQATADGLSGVAKKIEPRQD